ncbi:hypothetical protein HOP50_01g03720 [Chloropicon primus]|uniref:PHD-type domain-containing protein n=2 Tax=Chloropicon primus TaxID=1764295 RepID=A0A5B8MBM2_9CHLO|nr:hypothetical protein A3770_01p03840 [Chloropicon primus]UPQ97081.1 hypothetical protein HOP50_01g03720 [Chloropicon primus]|eukprot:QDZ17866.1 hypothetical protein A3770_01p03840 [Chloropicon primus]
MERSVTRTEWVSLTGASDPDSPFWTQDKDGWEDPVGQEVVLFLQGFEEVAKSLDLAPPSTLRWTSFRARRASECGLSGRGIRVESTAQCVVKECWYLVRERGEEEGREVPVGPAEPTEDEQAREQAVVAEAAALLEGLVGVPNPTAPPAAEGAHTAEQAAAEATALIQGLGAPAPPDEAPAEGAHTAEQAAAEATALIQGLGAPAPPDEAAAQGAGEPPNPAEQAEAPEAGAGVHDDEAQEANVKGEPFLRLKLRRLTVDGKGSEFFLDYHVNSKHVDCGEYVVKRSRYDRAMRKRLKIGDRVKMFWRDPVQIDMGNWFKGTVQSTHRSASSYSDHLLKDSKWESLEVLWELSSHSRELSRVSPWEIELLPKYDEEGKLVGGNKEVAFNPREYLDQEWMPKHRNKRMRFAAPNIPDTMAKGHNTKTFNWSSALCHVCKQPDNLVKCGGQCLRSFHAHCIPDEDVGSSSSSSTWFCRDCREGNAFCAICNKSGKAGVDVHKCRMGGCGSFYHLECLKELPAWSVGWGQKNERNEGSAERHIELFQKGAEQKAVFVCPGHFCHECHLSGDALRILRCSNCNMHAYHASHVRWDHCVKVASEKNLICPYCTYNAFHPEGASAMPPLLTYTPTFEPGSVVGRVKKISGQAAELFLVGKKRFLFGSHTKGGGCDFVLNLKGVKFHSEIVAESPGKYYIRCNAGGSKCKAPLVLNHVVITGGERVYLKDGDDFDIGSNKFVFEILKPGDESIPGDKNMRLKFPDEISLERAKATPSHAEDQHHMNALLEKFEISNYNSAFSKLKKVQQKQKGTPKGPGPLPESSTKAKSNRSQRERKATKYSDMWYSDEEEIIMEEPDEDEDEDDTQLDKKLFASNPILPPPLPDSPGKGEEGVEMDDYLGQVSIFQSGVSETAEIQTQTEARAMDTRGTQTEGLFVDPPAPRLEGTAVVIKREPSSDENGGDVVMTEAQQQDQEPKRPPATIPTDDAVQEGVDGGDIHSMIEKKRLHILELERQKILVQVNMKPDLRKLEDWVEKNGGEEAMASSKLDEAISKLDDVHCGFSKEALIRWLMLKNA